MDSYRNVQRVEREIVIPGNSRDTKERGILDFQKCEFEDLMLTDTLGTWLGDHSYNLRISKQLCRVFDRNCTDVNKADIRVFADELFNSLI